MSEPTVSETERRVRAYLREHTSLSNDQFTVLDWQRIIRLQGAACTTERLTELQAALNGSPIQESPTTLFFQAVIEGDIWSIDVG